ncbi:MAG: glycosyltransferase [Thermoguttaceae bacterium]
MKIMLLMGENVVESAGGAEKVLCNMANAMTQRGHQVTIVCDDAKQGRPFYPLDSNVTFHNLNGSGKKRQAPLLIRLIRKVINPIQKLFGIRPVYDIAKVWNFSKLVSIRVNTVTQIQPDVIVPFFLHDAETLIQPEVKLDCPVVLMLHNSPEVEYAELIRRRKLQDTVGKCNVLQVLLPSFAAYIRKYLTTKTVAIPNVVPQFCESDIAKLMRDKPKRTILMVARLDVKQKQQHFLIEAFAIVARLYPDWQVEFYGSEWTRGYTNILSKLIKKYGLENQIFLKGTTNDTINTLKQADIFAFPTSYEGFPLALTEAMAVGLPCVGLKTCSAVNELIVDGVNGFLAENDVNDFAAKLRVLMDDADLRTRMGKAGHEMVKQYAPDKIWDQWESLLYETVAEFKAHNVNK